MTVEKNILRILIYWIKLYCVVFLIIPIKVVNIQRSADSHLEAYPNYRYKYASAAAPQVYNETWPRSSNNYKYSTETLVPLLSLNKMQPTKYNKQALATH